MTFKAGSTVTPVISFFQNSLEEHQEQMPAVQFSLEQNLWSVF